MKRMGLTVRGCVSQETARVGSYPATDAKPDDDVEGENFLRKALAKQTATTASAIGSYAMLPCVSSAYRDPRNGQCRVGDRVKFGRRLPKLRLDLAETGAASHSSP